MFVGRENELRQLNDMYNGGKFEFVLLYGRRRVGKTELINEFIKDKPNIKFTATESTMEENLSAFSLQLCNYLGIEGIEYSSFDNLLMGIANIKERLVLVIDEYPYLAESCKEFSSILQKYIDTYLKSSKLFIIICGSSMSFMEREFDKARPLYGRKTGQLKLEPFTFFEARQMMLNYSIEDQFLTYSVTGGIPFYLSLFDVTKSVKENISKLFFSTIGALYDEPNNLLKQELRMVRTYNAVIRAIAKGATRNVEICNQTKLGSDACSTYIRDLIELGIVKKETPVLNETTKKTIYSLADGMFLFWYKYVPDYRLLIELGQGAVVYDLIEDTLPDMLGFRFEQVCKDWLKMQNAKLKLPFIITEIGRWWGNNPIEKEEEEIDIIATNGKDMILCECKYRNRATADGILSRTMRKGEQIFSKYTKFYYIFSKSEFSSECQELANKNPNVKLITLDDMLKSYTK